MSRSTDGAHPPGRSRHAPEASHSPLRLQQPWGRARLPFPPDSAGGAIAELARVPSRIVTKARGRCAHRRAARNSAGNERRPAARRQALFLLYQWDLTGQQLDLALRGRRRSLRRQLAEEVVARRPTFDERITAAASGLDGRPARRRGAQRPAHGDPRARPRRGAARGRIDEAVRLAKRYASAEGAALVNGILARIAREAA